MKLATLFAASGLTLALVSSGAVAGVVDPDCTPEKAAKSAAPKLAIVTPG